MLTEILQEAKNLPKVPEEAARDYQWKVPVLEEWVNRELESYPGISRVIGYNPLTMMHNNHHNHARFMANVFRFNAFELLAKTVIWVYRTYHSHGFSFDYFPLALSAWQQAVEALLEPPHARPVVVIYQWLLDRHQDMVQLSQEPVPDQFSLDPAWQTTRDAFLRALRLSSLACMKSGSCGSKARYRWPRNIWPAPSSPVLWQCSTHLWR